MRLTTALGWWVRKKKRERVKGKKRGTLLEMKIQKVKFQVYATNVCVAVWGGKKKRGGLGMGPEEDKSPFHPGCEVYATGLETAKYAQGVGPKHEKKKKIRGGGVRPPHRLSR